MSVKVEKEGNKGVNLSQSNFISSCHPDGKLLLPQAVRTLLGHGSLIKAGIRLSP